MDRKLLNFYNINPYVRYVNLLQCDPGFTDGPRCIYDHQFVYVHKGKGSMEIAGRIYTAISGDLFFYGPGTIHTFHADDREPYLLTGIHFDFTCEYKDREFPIGPFALSGFSEKLITEKIEFADFTGFPAHIRSGSSPGIRDTILQMLYEFEGGKIYSREYVNGLFKMCLSLIARNLVLNGNEPDEREEVINQVLTFVQKYYSEELTNESIAERFHFHPNYLNHLMVKHTGVSLRQYLINFRIRKALDMLLHTRLSVKEIAEATGFKDIHYFSRMIKKKTGMSPVQVRCGKIEGRI